MPGAPPREWPHYGIGFGGAIKRGFEKYATFRGRASRAEYWWWQLFITLAMWAWLLLFYAAVRTADSDYTLVVLVAALAAACYLVVLLPTLAVSVRRLHDAGHSGWTYFVSAIPLVGGPILIAFLASPTSPRASWYGPPEQSVAWPGTPATAGAMSAVAWGAEHGQPGVAPSDVPQAARPARTGVVVGIASIGAALAIVVVVAATGIAGAIQDWALQRSAGQTGISVPSVAVETTSADPVPGEVPTSESSTPIPEVVGEKPERARACPTVYNLDLTPARSAVNAKTTTCEFAEEVRRAYVESGRQGRDVTLTDVYSPRTHKTYTMACTGADTVTCVGGVQAEVFLY